MQHVEFFGDVLSRIQWELETRELSESSAEKLFATYTLFYQEALHALPELTCHSDDDVRVARANQLPSSVDVMLYDHGRTAPESPGQEVDQNLTIFSE